MLTTTLRRRAATVLTAGVLALGVGFATDTSVSAAPIIRTTPPDTTPVTVTTPDTVTPDTTPTTTPNNQPDDDDDGLYFLGFILIAVLVIGVIAIVTAMNRRTPSQPARTAADAQREQQSVMGAAQWYHDQLAPQLMSEEPAAALQRWGYERRRVESIIAAANEQAIGPDDPWHHLSDAVVRLTTSLDTLTGVRAQQPPNDEAIAGAMNAVTRYRTELNGVLVTLWPMVQGR